MLESVACRGWLLEREEKSNAAADPSQRAADGLVDFLYSTITNYFYSPSQRLYSSSPARILTLHQILVTLCWPDSLHQASVRCSRGALVKIAPRGTV